MKVRGRETGRETGTALFCRCKPNVTPCCLLSATQVLSSTFYTCFTHVSAQIRALLVCSFLLVWGVPLVLRRASSACLVLAPLLRGLLWTRDDTLELRGAARSPPEPVPVPVPVPVPTSVLMVVLVCRNPSQQKESTSGSRGRKGAFVRSTLAYLKGAAGALRERWR